jgi:hypothetical protein
VSGKPDLKPWHTARLDDEFTRAASGCVDTLAEYQQLETRLFGQLEREVYERTDESDRRLLNRYAAGGRADPSVGLENANLLAVTLLALPARPSRSRAPNP